MPSPSISLTMLSASSPSPASCLRTSEDVGPFAANESTPRRRSQQGGQGVTGTRRGNSLGGHPVILPSGMRRMPACTYACDM